MRIHPTVFLMIASLTATLCQAEVYSWKDASGKVHYGDRPPSAQKADTRKLAAPPPVDAEAERKAFAERQMAEREKKQKSQEAGKTAQDDQAEAQRRAAGCQQAKANLAAIEAGQVRFAIDARGERVALDGAVREAELAKARSAMASWCSPPAN